MVEASSSKPVTPAKRASSESSSVAEDGFERLAELTSSADNTKGVLDLGNPPFPPPRRPKLLRALLIRNGAGVGV